MNDVLAGKAGNIGARSASQLALNDSGPTTRLCHRPRHVFAALSQSLPSPALTALYRSLLEDTITLSKSLGGVEVAVVCPEADEDELASARAV